MNRRNFFKNLGAATVGVIVAPVVIIKTLKKEPETLCGKGLLRWIKEQPRPIYGSGQFSLAEFKELVKMLENEPPGWAVHYQWVNTKKVITEFYVPSKTKT